MNGLSDCIACFVRGYVYRSVGLSWPVMLPYVCMEAIMSQKQKLFSSSLEFLIFGIWICNWSKQKLQQYMIC